MRAALAGQVAAEIEDGVADELAGAVVGDVAAAVDLVDFYGFLGELVVRGEDVGAGGVAAEGEDGWVLKEDEGVADEAGFSGGDNLGLQAETFGVGDAAEMEEVDVHYGRFSRSRHIPLVIRNGCKLFCNSFGTGEMS